ncbi:transposase, IS605 OrfB family [Stanieria cyanosphaera PCC 7437]|uniref:Transposase, IS605 OrfB family n=1 Tax=Stanieria cyanosphaera (strain ATCC 29371 / PCC 7437) TaxID=111780 RepID=K9XTT0_STAC7|nr:RNA-guided endonuclease TnpB family protein [Stanieria cyanosphaera]AFZ35474.1 transposase, IS605 OrfB family [Stanieria cyanosphaera PCC 7437]
MPNYFVRKLKLEKTPQLDSLARAAGELYSRTLVSFWRTVRKKDIWLSGYIMERWHTSSSLHAHSSDAVTQSFYGSLKSWRTRRKTDPHSKPPKRRRWYFKVTWKKAAIKLKNGKLFLSNGRGNKSLVVDWRWKKPKTVELGWNKASQCYELRACYSDTIPNTGEAKGVAAADLGEIHPMVIADGVNTDIFNGRYLRSVRRYQNKVKGKLAKLIDKKKRGSKRRKRLIRSKQKQLAKFNNQIKDIEHKLTSRAVSMLKLRGIQTLVIGDVRDIRDDLDDGKKNNQKLHQWSFGSIRHKLEYKCARAGIKTTLITEEYTSQECLCCRTRNKPKKRNYLCNSCHAKFHRDQVGSNNIRAKYLGEVPVVGIMAVPSGVRYHSHLQCNLSEAILLGNPLASSYGE